MSGADTDLTLRQARAARRLSRLFRIERAGGYARRPAETMWRLIARRGTLVAELTGTERARRAAGAPSSAELDTAIGELRREIGLSRRHGEARLVALRTELDARHGRFSATGLRNRGAGRLLGSG